ncbi:MAG: class I SAM-dependent methyltransferase, partial [Actinomycetota bacterium]|nr:class I SAM-dependent methyltransferase [Actinomycetota bacterium]
RKNRSRAGAARMAARWWLEAQTLPRPVRRFRRKAIALTVRSGDLRPIWATLPTSQLKTLLTLTEGRDFVVEIGTGWGWTAASIVLANPTCTVETYDPWAVNGPLDYLRLLPDEARARIGLVKARGEDAALPNRPVDLMFVDESHQAERIVATFMRWRQALPGDALLVFDDFGNPSWPGVKAAIAQLGLSGQKRGRFYVVKVPAA